MDFSLHEGTDRVDFRYMLRERVTGELMTDRVQYIFLELPNSLGIALKPEATVLQNFCYALHMMEHLTERPEELKDEIFRLLFDSAEIANFAPEEKAKYEQNMTTERDIRNQIAYARDKGLEEGREVGREEGMKEGIQLLAEQLRKMGFPEEKIEEAVKQAKTS